MQRGAKHQMFNKEDILARLQNGDSADAIAQEMATALNEAQTAYDEAKAAEDKAKVEADRVLNAKRAAVEIMLDGASDYLIAIGETGLQKEVRDIEIDKVIELFDGTIEMAKSLEKLKDLQFDIPVCGRSSKVAKLQDPDAILRNFLASL